MRGRVCRGDDSGGASACVLETIEPGTDGARFFYGAAQGVKPGGTFYVRENKAFANKIAELSDDGESDDAADDGTFTTIKGDGYSVRYLHIGLVRVAGVQQASGRALRKRRPGTFKLAHFLPRT